MAEISRVDELFQFVNASKQGLVEVKLSTAPLDDETKILRGHLRDGVLAQYFAVRDYLGLLCISFVCEGEALDPVSLGSNERYPHSLPAAWAAHLAFVDAGILGDGKKAPARANALHEAIMGQQRALAERFLPAGKG